MNFSTSRVRKRGRDRGKGSSAKAVPAWKRDLEEASDDDAPRVIRLPASYFDSDDEAEQKRAAAPVKMWTDELASETHGRTGHTRHAAPPPRNNPRVYMDVAIDGKAAGRLEMELYAHKVPRTAENFRALCAGSVQRRGSSLTFSGSPFHRIIPGFMAQGGDITDGNGTGGESIYGPTFEDENFDDKHTHRGQLSMANCGRDTNNSQFFLTFKATPWLNGKHVVFGRVVRGMEVVEALEALGTKSGEPRKKALVTGCGEARPRDGRGGGEPRRRGGNWQPSREQGGRTHSRPRGRSRSPGDRDRRGGSRGPGSHRDERRRSSAHRGRESSPRHRHRSTSASKHRKRSRSRSRSPVRRSRGRSRSQ